MQALVRTEAGGYSNLVLKSQLARFAGTAQEKAFAAAVFYGAVERKNTLDYCLGKFLQKPLSRLDAPVRAILRAGLYQAKYMQSVPVHAAVPPHEKGQRRRPCKCRAAPRRGGGRGKRGL